MYIKVRKKSIVVLLRFKLPFYVAPTCHQLQNKLQKGLRSQYSTKMNGLDPLKNCKIEIARSHFFNTLVHYVR